MPLCVINITELYSDPLLIRDFASGSEITQGVQRLGYGLSLILGGRRDFSRLHSVSSSTEVHSNLYSLGTGCFCALNFPLRSPLVKRLELEANNSHSVEGSNVYLVLLPLIPTPFS